MFRCDSIKAYNKKIKKLSLTINDMIKNHYDAHEVIDKEIIMLSYIIEKSDFRNNYN